jgi:DNA-binding NarL/FixJ family response regulator
MDFDTKRDMGLSPKQQEARWNELFNSKLVKQPKAKKSVAKKAPASRQPKTNNTLKPRALEMFAAGKSIKEVAEALDITSANARYYFDRVFKKNA